MCGALSRISRTISFTARNIVDTTAPYELVSKMRASFWVIGPLLARFGVTSTCRASFGLYNTREEVDALADALDYARSFFA